MSRNDPIRRWDIVVIKMMVITIVLGTVTGMAVSLFGQSRDSIEQTTFVSNIRSFGGSARLYHFKHARPLASARPGAIPDGLEVLIDGENWIGGTPIGGAWHITYREYGVKSAIGVVFNGQGATRDDLYMTEVDARIDDGNLDTGNFRKLAENVYYLVLSE